jgi:hypothetical protein
MKRITSLFVAFAMVFGLAITTSYAGCKLTVKIQNMTKRSITVDKSKSQVKVKGGVWKKLGRNTTEVRRGDTISIPYSAAFGCNAKRQYRVKWSGQGEGGYKYYPNTSTFTTRQEILVTIR